VADEVKKGLVAKLCEVMAATGWVEKSGTNQKQGYKYATEADVLSMLRQELAKRGVFIFPSIESVSRAVLYETQAGNTMHVTDVMVKWTFLDGETGETHECLMPGCGTDTGDKGLYKAITGSSKYLFLKAFMLPTGDDPEEEKPDHAEGVAAAKKVAVEKLKEAANGDESIILTPGTQGRIVLAGKGVAIARAAMSELEKEMLGIAWDAVGKLYTIPDTVKGLFVSTCVRLKIPTIEMDAAQGQTNGGEKQPSPLSPSRIINDVKQKSGMRKDKLTEESIPWALLEVTWGGERHTVWDKKLWPLLVMSRGKSALLSTVPSFDKKKDPTIDGIIQIDGVQYEEKDGKLVAVAAGA
jgi:hypothetical protein